jgi:L-ascorbate metabolism protein UlaG (beta-lactamase superfamily)
MRITWLGHATFLVETGRQTIYIDPYLDPYSEVRLPKATMILISHWHPDHCTRESVEKLRTDGTVILGTADVAREFLGAKALNPGDKAAVAETTIRAMPAKTLHRRGGHDEEGFVIGFVVEAEGKKLYYTSDTDPLPEMIGLAPDVVLIPVGGTTTMGPEEAAKAVHAMRAKLAIPAHWGSQTGTRDDAEIFKEILEREREHKAVILAPGEMVDA